MSAAVQVIVITGTMGAGKTTLLGEASDLLTAQGVTHAAIDLDALGMGHFDEAAWPDLAYRNLASVWQNFLAAGVTRLLLAEAVENVTELSRIREAVPGSEIVVCRLTAALDTMRARVAQREVGHLRDTFVARVAELQRLVDRASLEDFTLSTDDGLSVTDVAREMLARANWP